MKYLYLAIINCVFLLSCREGENSSYTAEGNDAYVDLSVCDDKTVLFSDVIDSIEYMPLETGEQCLIGYITKIIPVGDTIVVVDNERANRVFLYDMNGKFIRQISSRGDSPESYVALRDVAIDKQGGRVFILDAATMRLLMFSMDGNFIKSMKLPFVAHAMEYIGGEKMAFYFKVKNPSLLNEAGKYPLLGLWDMKSEKLLHVGVYQDDEILQGAKVMSLNPLCMTSEGDVAFIQDACDTIYSVTMEGIKVKHVFYVNEDNRKNIQEYIGALKGATNLKEALSLRKTYPFYTLQRQVFSGGIYVVGLVSADKSYMVFINEDKEMMVAVGDKKTPMIKNDMDKISPFQMGAGDDKGYVYSVIEPKDIILPQSIRLSPVLDSLRHRVDKNDNPIIVKFKMKKQW